MDLLILTTGGTIDKVYFDAKSDFEVGDPQIGHILEEARVGFGFEVRSLMQKDSLEITDEDRVRVRQAVESADQDRILITHGTDTMAETGRVLTGLEGKTVVLTGALNPARMRSSDAIFNIGMAVAAVQVLDPGIYICMNGLVFDADRVRKDRENNRFEAV